MAPAAPMAPAAEWAPVHRGTPMEPIVHIRVLRPARGSLLALRQIAWGCANFCPEQIVKLTDQNGDDVWSRMGDKHLDYDGPSLKPGNHYVLNIGGQRVSLMVPDSRRDIDEALDAAKGMRAALERAGVADLDTLLTPEIGAWMAAGMASEALYRLDEALNRDPENPYLKAMRNRAALRAGVAP